MPCACNLSVPSKLRILSHICCVQNITVGQGQCAAVLPTSTRLSDQQGHLHAGCYCSLVDLISTTALASIASRTAVSVTISVDFYAPLAIGQELAVESRMVKAGKTLTFAEIDFRCVFFGIEQSCVPVCTAQVPSKYLQSLHLSVSCARVVLDINANNSLQLLAQRWHCCVTLS